METANTNYNRRSFLKVSALAGGGMLIGFNLFSSAKAANLVPTATPPGEAAGLTSFIKISPEGKITILAPNPEFGQNVKTAMPMIVAEELDVDWQQVIVEQAPFNTKLYGRQFTGGSQGIRQGWKSLRTAGASARQMLIEAAAQAWQVPAAEITTEAGVLHHKASGKSAGYGAMASAAAALPVPKDVKLKAVNTFKILSTSHKNVEGTNIVTGKPLFGLDYRQPGMLIAMMVHPPAFGQKLKSFDATPIRKMPGIQDVFSIQVYPDEYERQIFDDRTFNELVVIVGRSTWEVMQAKKKLRVNWESMADRVEKENAFGQKREVTIPGGLESTDAHYAKMKERDAQPAKQLRRDGDPEGAFKSAAKVIERTYTAPFLAHNNMEPLNCFAHVTPEKAFLAAGTQAPDFIERTIAARLGMPIDKIDIQLTRMGGGFGRKAYCHYMVEAALISQKMKAPVKLIYTREDDMTYGIYRPMYSLTFRAAFDAANNLTGFHVRGGGIPESPLGRSEGNFPAGAIDNYLADEWALPSNITIGAFRAPRSNFIAGAQQAFLDEVAEAMGKDPIDFRLELLERAKKNPVGKNNTYEVDRYAGVLKLVRDKSGWGQGNQPGVHRGVAVYFCHNSYAAHVVDLSMKDGQPVVERVTSAVDCGVVINPIAASNMIEGAVVDGIGNALFGNLTVKDGKPDQSNFDKYRMIRHNEAPKKIDVHFVQNEIDPTGLGEPPFPPVIAALANALYKATGKRLYTQPFGPQLGKSIQG
ncbi:xanthine dehydrogenase family protein molybdopterin-binding subunit [Fibrella sp. HMF5335]|uniref:Xanthine dehydrogenase family protein molybdopterin-binding subunit n=1 Tax=Fibrella rubiginis TaxID=2817060 RepID=A0A939GIJ8_9BACT|nr:molybdopterin cofactor-binding domain-containing protein [Fibrella rubiginis]MBO0937082.1 xanthine dehydrogenase family protein molybdopterin-binding subunit [Fibrella rubiginis]